MKGLCKAFFEIDDACFISAQGLDIDGNDTEKILCGAIDRLTLNFDDGREGKNMKKSKERNKIIKELLDITDREFTDEELIHKLIMTEMTEKDSDGEKTSFGQRAADAVAKFAGTGRLFSALSPSWSYGWFSMLCWSKGF